MPRYARRAVASQQPPSPLALPMPAALVAARRRGEREWQRHSVRRGAREVMAALTGGTLGDAELDALARRHVLETEARHEFLWRARAFDRLRIEGSEHLEAALAQGRGVLLSFCHYGPYYGVSHTASRFGKAAHVVGAESHFVPGSEATLTMRQRQTKLHVERGGGRFVPAEGSFERLTALLRAGEVVAVAFDFKGRTPTPFLGRTVPMASGTARMAVATGALVVPVLHRREGGRPISMVGAELDPLEHDGLQGLQDALARHHGDRIAADPATIKRTGVVRLLVEEHRHGALELAA